MIYHKKLLALRVLLENTSKKNISGIFRPSVYMDATGTFFTTARIDLKEKQIEPGESEVIRIILESPAGFGEHLKKGEVLSVRNGLDEVGRALVLEILGYTEDLNK